MAEPLYRNQQTRTTPFSEPGEPASPPSDMQAAAERVGDAVGSAVEKVKQLPDRLQEMKDRFTVIRGRAQEDLSARASELADDLKQQAQLTVSRARTRADRLRREKPLAVILGAAAVGLVLGIVLRLWRDHAD